MINYKIIEEWNGKCEYSPHNSQLNCFGAVALYFGFITAATWLDYRKLQEFIDNNMEEVQCEDVQVGDVYALYDEKGLLHVAIFLGEQYWHKPGKWKAEFADKDSVEKNHISSLGKPIPGTYTRYHRLVKNKG